jgi:hypothetical protein
MLDMHMRGVKNEPSDNEEQNLAISERRRTLQCQKEMPRISRGACKTEMRQQVKGQNLTTPRTSRGETVQRRKETSRTKPCVARRICQGQLENLVAPKGAVKGQNFAMLGGRRRGQSLASREKYVKG